MQIRSVNITKQQADALLSSGWSFDWSRSGSSTSAKFGLLVSGSFEGLVEFDREPQNLCNRVYWLEIDPHNRGTDKKYYGVAGALLAYVARDSFINGFEGFIVFESKTDLISYYISQYGATRIGSSQEMYFDTVASRKLINEYLVGKEIEYD